MNVRKIIEEKTIQEKVDLITDLAKSKNNRSISNLSEFLLIRDDHTFEKHITPRIACRALLSLGKKGIHTMKDLLPKSPGSIYPVSIIEAIWYTSKGLQPPDLMLENIKLTKKLKKNPTQEMINESKNILREIIIDSITNRELFDDFIQFIYSNNFKTNITGENDFQNDFFSVITDCTMKINRGLINEFKSLINKNKREEEYQIFLRKNPFFLDPLAYNIFSKKKLGIEHTTDFVIQRLDDEYILVEIEKPSDKIFTSKDDFSAHFTHAYGQVIDFLEWIDSNGEYARKLMPNISSPKGLLIIGMKKNLSDKQLNKLNRLNRINNSIDIITYDDLITKANNLYTNLVTQKNDSL